MSEVNLGSQKWIESQKWSEEVRSESGEPEVKRGCQKEFKIHWYRELSKRFSSSDSSIALTWVESEHAWAELSMSWAHSGFLRLRLELFFNPWAACWLDFARILWQLKLWPRRRRRINSSRTVKTSSSRQNQLNFLAQSRHWTASLAIVFWAHSSLYEPCHQSANARSSFSMQISMRLLFAVE